MTRPDILACALWLQREIGAFILACDHPDLPACAGAHGPETPCDGQRGKHPCGRWSRDSVRSSAAIGAALSHGPRNIGIDCGKSGLLVVDEDRPAAFAGFAREAGERVPLTFTVVTAKGAHFYFRQPEGRQLGNGRGRMAGQGIDVRGAGGFVIAPGSVHQTGVIYRPADASAPVAPLPGWLAEALAAPTAPVRAAGGRASVHGRMRGLAAAVLAAQQGERNNVLFWSACRAGELVAAGEADEAAAVTVLTRAAEMVGLGAGETAATIASGMKGAVR